MILEGIVTTLSLERRAERRAHGPVDRSRSEHGAVRAASVSYVDDLSRISRRAARACFTSPTTSCSWPRRRSARPLFPAPATRPADVIAGQILTDACRYYEFRVVELDDREERTAIVVETVAQGRHRDFFGFNRAKHAVVEAAILATRADWLPIDEMLVEFRKLAVLVDKTGGPRERAAFTLLHRHVRETAERRGLEPDPSRSPP